MITKVLTMVTMVSSFTLAVTVASHKKVAEHWRFSDGAIFYILSVVTQQCKLCCDPAVQAFARDEVIWCVPLFYHEMFYKLIIQL